MQLNETETIPNSLEPLKTNQETSILDRILSSMFDKLEENTDHLSSSLIAKLRNLANEGKLDKHTHIIDAIENAGED